MTEDKLYEFVQAEYFKVPNDILEFTRRASFCIGQDSKEDVGFTIQDGKPVMSKLTQYEQLILKTVIKIILTNFTLTDKNARH